MRPRPGLLRLWSRCIAAGHPNGDGRRAFSFTQSIEAAPGYWTRMPRARPQLPFLAVPTTTTKTATPAPRYFTTQRKRWLRYEALAFAKYTMYFWAAVGCVVLAQFVLQQEWMERMHPTPPEWSFMSRFRLRGALSEMDDSGSGGSGGDGDLAAVESGGASMPRVVDRVKVIQILLDLIKRLEDPRVDGGSGLVGVMDVVEMGHSKGESGDEGAALIMTDDQAMDIRAKSEPWRRGYFEALLAAAAAAEHVDGWVRDRTRNIVCSPDVVVGPSNPDPRPLPPGASGAPREEDCEPCFPTPAELYLKLLHTRGLTPHQQITASLAFANYLEYKADHDAAAFVYGRAVLVAARGPPAPESVAPLCAGEDEGPDLCSFFTADVDKADATAWILAWTAENHGAALAGGGGGAADSQFPSPSVPISQNLLATLTAYATFKARTGDVVAALPIFISLLQARLSLPPSKSTSSAMATADAMHSPATGIIHRLIAIASPPAYPPPPDDGFGPPLPGPRTRCEEAALRLHIGEILYASAESATSTSSWIFSSASAKQQHAREEGIAWTREAVDIAEEQLHVLGAGTTSGDEDSGLPGLPGQPGQPGQQQGVGLQGAAFFGFDAPSDPASEGRATCRECLVAGLDNWSAMVAQLARDEQRRQQQQQQQRLASTAGGADSSGSWWPSWLALWGDGPSQKQQQLLHATHGSDDGKKAGRWAAEEQVIKQRRRRAQELIDNATPPPRGILGLFAA